MGLLAALVWLTVPGMGHAQPVASPEQPVTGATVLADPLSGQMKRSLELSAGAQNLSAGYGGWRDLTLRGSYGLPGQLLQGEVSTLRRFNQNGSYIGVGDTVTFNQDWYGSVAAGAGDGAFYLPRYRIDATLYRKWLADRNLVTSVGGGYYSAPDGHTDRSLSLGLVYYFKAPWIVEGGVRFNSSNPGSVRTHQQFAAVTWGRDKQDLVTGRYGWGGEGYLATGPSTQLVNFQSDEASLAWRHWVTPQTGVLMSVNRYKNPLYIRSGLSVGIFHDF
ncbi:MAG: putative lipoprotein [Polaromonas sp.]|nr:putative lipoprotein [Polaromonas sp.]